MPPLTEDQIAEAVRRLQIDPHGIIDAIATERERCAKIAEAEPELTGHMPDEVHLIPLDDALRAVCRATKKSIAAAIRNKE